MQACRALKLRDETLRHAARTLNRSRDNEGTYAKAYEEGKRMTRRDALHNFTTVRAQLALTLSQAIDLNILYT